MDQSEKSVSASFANDLNTMFRNAATVSNISIGTKLGLFKKLSEISPNEESAVTSTQLAEALNFKERYVREWIRGTAAARITEHVCRDGEHYFWLPVDKHRALVGNKQEWMAQYSELIVGFVAGQDKIIECFPVDGPRGTHVDDHPGLHNALQRGRVFWKHQENIPAFFAELPELSKLLKSGIDVIELGCGTAHPTKAFAQLYPHSKFTASDLSQDVLNRAIQNCAGLDNVTCRTLNACEVTGDEGQYDLVCIFDVLHDVPFPDQLLSGVFKILKPGGYMVLNDIDLDSDYNVAKNEAGSTLYFASSTHYCMPTSHATPGAAALGATAGRQLYQKMIEQTGFVSVERFMRKMGLYFCCRKPGPGVEPVLSEPETVITPDSGEIGESQKFCKRLELMFKDGSATALIAMGNRLKLFKGLADIADKEESAVTSQQLADRMGYKERFVREWIRGMASCDVIEHVCKNNEHYFWLPQYKHLALIGDTKQCLAHEAEYFVALSTPQDLVVKCFPVDGPEGTNVDDHPELHNAMQRGNVFFEHQENIPTFFSELPKLDNVLKSGINVIELGCGTAHPTKAFAQFYPRSKFTATDLSQDVLNRAFQNCAGLDNVICRTLDACNIPDSESGIYDLACMFHLMHTVPYPVQLLAGVYKLLKPGGYLIFDEVNADSDFNVNKAHGDVITFFYTASIHYCLPTALSTPGAAGLGACAGRQFYQKLVEQAGFTDILTFMTSEKTCDSKTVHFFCQKPK